MSRAKPPPQRYRLTHEFVLKNPRDYHGILAAITAALRMVEESTPNFCADYLACEKLPETPEASGRKPSTNHE